MKNKLAALGLKLDGLGLEQKNQKDAASEKERGTNRGLKS